MQDSRYVQHTKSLTRYSTRLTILFSPEITVLSHQFHKSDDRVNRASSSGAVGSGSIPSQAKLMTLKTGAQNFPA